MEETLNLEFERDFHGFLDMKNLEFLFFINLDMAYKWDTISIPVNVQSYLSPVWIPFEFIVDLICKGIDRFFVPFEIKKVVLNQSILRTPWFVLLQQNITCYFQRCGGKSFTSGSG